MRDWEAIPDEDIREQHGQDIFDSADIEQREQIVLEDTPLVDNNGREIMIYDQDGRRIPRREAHIDEGTEYNGMLFNLKTIHQLFQWSELADDVEDINDSPMTPHYLYPMACLKTIGHFQAEGLMTPFLRKLKELNKWIKERYDGGDEGNIAAELLTGYSPLIEGIACQGYNLLSHQVWAQGRYHDMQQGNITTAFSGTHRMPTTNSNIAQKVWRECETWLPFEWYHQRITGAPVDTSTRIENVYQISLRRLPRQSCNGR